MFRNEIIKLNHEQVKQILKSAPDDFLVVEINGERIQTWEQYTLTIEKNMNFPTTCIDSIARYEDWICDLEWLAKRGFIIVIYNFDKFMKNNPRIKGTILCGFEELILPWWQSEVEKCSPRKVSPFNVYLVD